MFPCGELIKNVQEQHAVLPILLFQQYGINYICCRMVWTLQNGMLVFRYKQKTVSLFPALRLCFAPWPGSQPCLRLQLAGVIKQKNIVFFVLTTNLTKPVESVITAFFIATDQIACQQVVFEHVCILNSRSFELLLVVMQLLFLAFFFSVNIFAFFHFNVFFGINNFI